MNQDELDQFRELWNDVGWVTEGYEDTKALALLFWQQGRNAELAKEALSVISKLVNDLEGFSPLRDLNEVVEVQKKLRRVAFPKGTGNEPRCPTGDEAEGPEEPDGPWAPGWEDRSNPRTFHDPESGLDMDRGLWYVLSDSGSAYTDRGFMTSRHALHWAMSLEGPAKGKLSNVGFPVYNEATGGFDGIEGINIFSGEDLFQFRRRVESNELPKGGCDGV